MFSILKLSVILLIYLDKVRCTYCLVSIGYALTMGLANVHWQSLFIHTLMFCKVVSMLLILTGLLLLIARFELLNEKEETGKNDNLSLCVSIFVYLNRISARVAMYTLALFHTEA